MSAVGRRFLRSAVLSHARLSLRSAYPLIRHLYSFDIVLAYIQCAAVQAALIALQTLHHNPDSYHTLSHTICPEVKLRTLRIPLFRRRSSPRGLQRGAPPAAADPTQPSCAPAHTICTLHTISITRWVYVHCCCVWYASLAMPSALPLPFGFYRIRHCSAVVALLVTASC